MRLALLFRQGPLKRGERAVLASFGTVVLAAMLYPLWASTYGITVVRDIMLLSIFALSLDYLWGKAGVLTLGHATFFGIGAYAMGILTVKLGASSLAGLLAGLGVAAALALVVGSFLIFAGVRLQYFAIVTIALTLVSTQIALSSSALTGGDAGLLGVPPLTFELFGARLELSDNLSQYFVALALVTVVFLGLWLVCRGNYGKILAAIRMNEYRARSLGHHTDLHLLIVFIMSAVLAALSGVVFAAVSGFVAPDLVGPLLSTEVVVWVAAGGRGTLFGPMIGAFVVTRLQQEISSIATGLWPLVLGVFFVLLVCFFPDGAISVGRHVKAMLTRRRIGVRRQSA